MDPNLTASLGRSLRTTKEFVRTQLWLWPLVAAVVLGVIGVWVRGTVEEAMKSQMRGELETILSADVAALEIWLGTQESNAATLAADPRVRSLVAPLLDQVSQEGTSGAKLLASSELAQLRDLLAPSVTKLGHNGFIVADAKHRILVAMRDEPVGKQSLAGHAQFLDKALAGEPTVSRPFPSAVILEDANGESRAGLPTMFAAAPILGDDGKIVAALALRIRPKVDFTRILTIARYGESGETYAFDADGLLISQSRFDDDLKRIGLIPDRADSHSILNIQIRDPEVDMTQGDRPEKLRAQQELTHMAQEAINADAGSDVDGYADYRGVPVIGAWTWLPEYGFGVATEVDVAEAYRPLYVLRMAFLILFSLLVVSAIAIFIFMLVVSRLQRSVRRAVIEAKQLGQYTLEDKIGAGGMGVVYRAHHAMLRRPTAVKLLDVDKTTDATITRFEREVQMTAHLNHPNTIEIYDYGRTPEGVFYYAMEYLDGVTLEDLVGQFGPQAEGRVIHILRQVCGSLAEAHGVGLIHRDIKPANIILNQRGGMSDVVKVLDFGLVKAIDSGRETSLTAANSLTGTPLYLSPEAIQQADQVDARSDLYAVGAVGYYLVTGTPLFDGQNVVEVCMHQVNTEPERPSARLDGEVSQDLEAIIMQCLAKQPADRPDDAQGIIDALSACQSAAAWQRTDAEAWWAANVAHVAATPPEQPTRPGFDMHTVVYAEGESSGE